MVDPPPSIIIVGAGLGGLALAALLEHINVSYVILERLTEVKTNGTYAIFKWGPHCFNDKLGRKTQQLSQHTHTHPSASEHLENMPWATLL